MLKLNSFIFVLISFCFMCFVTLKIKSNVQININFITYVEWIGYFLFLYYCFLIPLGWTIAKIIIQSFIIHSKEVDVDSKKTLTKLLSIRIFQKFSSVSKWKKRHFAILLFESKKIESNNRVAFQTEHFVEIRIFVPSDGIETMINTKETLVDFHANVHCAINSIRIEFLSFKYRWHSCQSIEII